MDDLIIVYGVVINDTINFVFTIDEDLTDWKVRAEFYDDCGNFVQLATTNSGGSNSQVNITATSSTESTFTVKVPKAQTTNFENPAHLEIELENSSEEVFTVLPGKKTSIEIIKEKINWTTPS